MTNLGALLSTAAIPKDALRLALGRSYGYAYTAGRNSDFQTFTGWSVINGSNGDVAVNIVPKGKSGAAAKLLIWGWASFYGYDTNCQMNLAVRVDGGFYQIGRTATNFAEHLTVAGVHTHSVSAGVNHLIELMAWDANVVMQFDYNDGAGLLVVEH